MSLHNLPFEMLLAIFDLLDESNGSALVQTSRYCYGVLCSYLYRRNVQQHGSSALFWAAITGSEVTARKALDEGATWKTGLCSRVLPPYGEPENTVYEKVKRWSNRYHNYEDHPPWTPMFLAVMNRREHIVELLVERAKAELDFTDRNDRTLLSYAAEYGLRRVVALFLARGNVDLNARQYSYRLSPVFYAVLRGHREIVSMLLKEQNNPIKTGIYQNLSHIAIRRGDVELVDLMLREKPALKDERDLQGMTPLAIAAENGRMELVRLLIKDHGLQPEVRDNNGRTPLLIAVENGYGHVVALLESLGADVCCRDWNRRTPLLLACKGGLVRFLLTHNGCNSQINGRDPFGFTPMYWAVRRHHIELSQLLKLHGAFTP